MTAPRGGAPELQNPVMTVTQTDDAGHLGISGEGVGYAVGRCAVLLKCANPKCSQQWHYLREGKLFHLSPTPKIQALVGDSSDTLDERFWLCDRCAKEMTLVWGGTQVRLIPLRPHPSRKETVFCNKAIVKGRTRERVGAGEAR